MSAEKAWPVAWMASQPTYHDITGDADRATKSASAGDLAVGDGLVRCLAIYAEQCRELVDGEERR